MFNSGLASSLVLKYPANKYRAFSRPEDAWVSWIKNCAEGNVDRRKVHRRSLAPYVVSEAELNRRIDDLTVLRAREMQFAAALQEMNDKEQAAAAATEGNKENTASTPGPSTRTPLATVTPTNPPAAPATQINVPAMGGLYYILVDGQTEGIYGNR